MTALTDVSPPPYISAQLIADALVQKGYTQKTFDVGEVYFELTSPEGWKWLTRRAYPYYPFMSLAATRISNNKWASYAFATRHGMSVPASISTTAKPAELREFLTAHAPLIVKPLNASGSKGLCLNITTEQQLQDAIKEAQQHAKHVIVQQQFEGNEVRFTILNGKVENCLLRQTPQVTGDGHSTVAQLIQKENEDRSALDLPYINYPQLDASLIPEKYLTDDTVPAAGEVIRLGQTSLPNYGASIYDVTDEVHESYKAMGLKLATELNPEFLAVDLLIADYRQPLTKDNYVLLEFSSRPSLRLYYIARNGTRSDIVASLADMVDEYGKRVVGMSA